MFNEEILLTIGLMAVPLWAAIDKLKPFITYRMKALGVDAKWKPRIVQVCAFIGALLLVWGTPDVRFVQGVMGRVTSGLLWQSFDVLVTAILVMLGNEGGHIVQDILRLMVGNKTPPALETPPNV